MARNDPQMNLRVPMELKEKIEKAALDNGRTITAEAVYRLEQSFEVQSPDSKAFEDASVRILGRVIDSLQKSGLSNDVILTALRDMSFNGNEKKAP